MNAAHTIVTRLVLVYIHCIEEIADRIVALGLDEESLRQVYRAARRQFVAAGGDVTAFRSMVAESRLYGSGDRAEKLTAAAINIAYLEMTGDRPAREANEWVEKLIGLSVLTSAYTADERSGGTVGKIYQF